MNCGLLDAMSTNRWRFLAVFAACVVPPFVSSSIAVSDDLAQAGSESFEESPLTDADRDYWAYRQTPLPTVPSIRNQAWLRAPLDQFVLAKREDRGIVPSVEAPRAVLLRRATLALWGMPVTESEAQDWLAASSPARATAATPIAEVFECDTYERLVDRLLASPRYGERSAQAWLDLARYADTDGFEHDLTRPTAWRYRDWVIASKNRDLGYDRFVIAQVTGRTEDGSEDLIPTMFGLAGPDMPDMNDQHDRRHQRLNELTATVGSVLLGMQFGCAQCHDHKYDPLSQGDFFRLRAVFESAIPILERDKPVHHLVDQSEPVLARFWPRGDARRPGPVVRPAPPRVLCPAGIPDWPVEKNVRDEFARWLVAADNPLFARVAVNRLWQFQFGRGLFATPADVGNMGAPPTHPELLDWMAHRFRRQDWSEKRMHREIMLSATYRQSGPQSRSHAIQSTRADHRDPDPDNTLWSRFPRRRLDAESVRDSLLSVSGLLTSDLGGPGVMPPLPPELLGTLLKGQWAVSPHEADHYRRSIYLFARRNLRYPILEVFDRPDANASCATRSLSNTASQALLMLNSQLSQRAAEELARRLLASVPADHGRSELVSQLFLTVYQRVPDTGELELLEAFITDPNGKIDAVRLRDACLALLNSNEFIYVD
jgi:hypothetical protein